MCLPCLADLCNGKYIFCSLARRNPLRLPCWLTLNSKISAHRTGAVFPPSSDPNSNPRHIFLGERHSFRNRLHPLKSLRTRSAHIIRERQGSATALCAVGCIRLFCLGVSRNSSIFEWCCQNNSRPSSQRRPNTQIEMSWIQRCSCVHR